MTKKRAAITSAMQPNVRKVLAPPTRENAWAEAMVPTPTPGGDGGATQGQSFKGEQAIAYSYSRRV